MLWQFQKRERYSIGWLQRTAATGFLKGAGGQPLLAHLLPLAKQKMPPALLKNACSLWYLGFICYVHFSMLISLSPYSHLSWVTVEILAPMPI